MVLSEERPTGRRSEGTRVGVRENEGAVDGFRHLRIVTRISGIFY